MAAVNWSTPELAERVSALATNLAEHVEHSEHRANTMTNQLAELVRITGGQSNTLSAIEAGQKAVKWMVGIGLTIFAIAVAFAGVAIAALKLVQ
jgi:hypothetical protein